MAMARDTLTLPVKKYLESKYYDPSFPGSFSGIDRFFKAVKEEGVYDLNKNDIAQWLMGEDAYYVMGVLAMLYIEWFIRLLGFWRRFI